MLFRSEPVLISNLATGSGEAASEYLRRFIRNAHAGAIGATGFLGLFVTSMSLLYSIDKAINRIWRATENRSWFQRLSGYWFFITLGPMALAVAVGLVTSKELPISRVLPGKAGLLLLSAAILFWLFKVVPNRRVHWRPALATCLATAAATNVASIAYGFYTKRLVSYDKIYGSLGAIPILLLWIYVIWVIILTGVAATAVLQRKYDFK